MDMRRPVVAGTGSARGAAWLLGAALLLSARAQLRCHPHSASTASQTWQGTAWGQTAHRSLPADSTSGFQLMPIASVAYGARLELAEEAQQTLDGSTTCSRKTRPASASCAPFAMPRAAVCACGCWSATFRRPARTECWPSWRPSRTPRCASTTRFRGLATRRRADGWPRCGTSGASTTGCTTSSSWPTTRLPCSAAATSAIRTSCARRPAISSTSNPAGEPLAPGRRAAIRMLEDIAFCRS